MGRYSLASVGGFELAASWLNWENVFQVEIDKFCQKVLEKNFPNVKKYGDIREFDGTKYRGFIDILTGGFPCQGFSVAGKQRGKSDPGWLWPEMFRVIWEVQPSWVVGENVPGIIRMALEDICFALEGEGYEVQPFIIPSASIGSWDKRDRVWIIAYNNRFRCNNEQKGQIKTLQNKIRITEAKKQGRRKQQCRIIESDWLRNWIEVASELCRSAARVLNRMDRIKALGNSINPHVAFEIFKAIEQYDNNSGIANHGRGL